MHAYYQKLFIINYRIKQIFDVCVNHLSGTQYEVAVFSLENHLPFPRVVSSPKLAAVANSNQSMKAYR